MAISKKILIIGGVLLLVSAVAVFLYFKNKPSTEAYQVPTLSMTGPMKQTPVGYAYQGNGVEENPSYQSDPTDRNVPLEVGGVDFYKDTRNLYDGRSFEEFEVNYGGPGKDLHLVNNSQTRGDLVDAGDITWFNILNNMVGDNHATADFPIKTEVDLIDPQAVDYSGGLYSPAYHKDMIGE